MIRLDSEHIDTIICLSEQKKWEVIHIPLYDYANKRKIARRVDKMYLKFTANKSWIFQSYILTYLLICIFSKIEEILIDRAEFSDLMEERKLEKKLIKEWKDFNPTLDRSIIERIFRQYGLISPHEFKEHIYACLSVFYELIIPFIDFADKRNNIIWQLFRFRFDYKKNIRRILRRFIKLISEEKPNLILMTK